MRYRIDIDCGYISIEGDYDKALKIYNDYDGIRIRKCKDIYDEGIVVLGKPIIVDLSKSFGERFENN